MRGHVLTVLLAAIAALVFGGSLVLSGGRAPSLGRDSVRLTLRAATAASLTPGSEVRIAGLEAGRVAAVRRRGDGAVLALDVDADQAPLPDDVAFAVRLRSLVGENYVELYPGERGGERDDYVELEQVLDQLRGRTRARAQRLLQGLGTGLAGRGDDLNRTLEDASPALDRLATVMTTLDGQRTAVRRLIADVGTIGRTVGARGDDLRTLAAQSRTAFTAVADRDAALRAMLERLPPTLAQVRTTSGTLRAVTRTAAPVVSDLARALTDLRPAVTALRPAAAEGRRLLAALDDVAPRLVGTLDRVRAVSGPAARALPALRGALCEADPLVRHLEPYTGNITAFAGNLASSTNFYDANGHAARLLMGGGENSFAPQTPETNAAFGTLLKAGLIGRVNRRGYQPFARPDDVSPPRTGDGATGPRSYPGTYPRVAADC